MVGQVLLLPNLGCELLGGEGQRGLGNHIIETLRFYARSPRSSVPCGLSSI